MSNGGCENRQSAGTTVTWADMNDLPDHQAYSMYEEVRRATRSDPARRSEFKTIVKMSRKVARSSTADDVRRSRVTVPCVITAILASLPFLYIYHTTLEHDPVHFFAILSTNSLINALITGSYWTLLLLVVTVSALLFFVASVYYVHRRDRVVHRLTVIAWVNGIPPSSLEELARIVRIDGNLEDVLYWWAPLRGGGGA